MSKTISIDLRWLLLPFTLIANLIANLIKLSTRALLGLFMLTGVGYLILKVLKGTGWTYTSANPFPEWNGDSLKFKVRKQPRWANYFLGRKARLYTVVGGPSEFFVKWSGRPAPEQKLMRGFYARFLHVRPAPLPPAPQFQIVPVPTPIPAPQPIYPTFPTNPYSIGGIGSARALGAISYQ